MTADLVQFLRDRLDEDGAVARAATAGPWTTMGQRVLDSSPPSNRLGIGMAVGHAAASADYNETAAHIARQDPARVLADIEAKRQIMECHESWIAANGDTICGRCGREHIDGRPGRHFPCQTLRLLALPYADHPDYRQDWRP